MGGFGFAQTEQLSKELALIVTNRRILVENVANSQLLFTDTLTLLHTISFKLYEKVQLILKVVDS